MRVSVFGACGASAVAGLLLITTGCSSSASAPASGDAVAGIDWQAQIDEYSALDPAQLEAQARALAGSVQRQLMTMSGLEKELGGPAAAAAALVTLSAKMQTAIQQFTARPTFGKFSAGAAGSGDKEMGGLIFGNMMIVGLGTEAAVAATNNMKPGESDSETKSDSDDSGSSSFTVSGSADKAQLDVGMKVTTDGVTGTLKSIIVVAPCPDRDGRFTTKTTMVASVSRAGASTGSSMTVDVTVTGQIDDDARLVTYDMETRTQSAQFEAGKGQFLDITLRFGMKDGGLGVTGVTVNRNSESATAEFSGEQSKLSSMMALMAKDKALEAAKLGWESGRCVTLKPTTEPAKRTGLEPSAKVKVFAAPRSASDGAPVGGTVMATLGGNTSVDPASTKVPADATFTYTAPSEKDQSAMVFLESRSKRGVGKAEIAFDTKAGGYVVDQAYGAPGGRISGEVCAVDAPFTLGMKNPSVQMTGTFTFTPTASGAGAWVYKGTAMGGDVTNDGSGTFTVDGLTAGRPVITMDAGKWSQTTVMGTYDSPGGRSETLELKPAPSGCSR
jgi:hypothetical protein